MLKLGKERGERAAGDGGINLHNRASHADTPTLSDLGVSPMQSSRWQLLARRGRVATSDSFLSAPQEAGRFLHCVLPAYLAVRTTSVGGPQDQLLDLTLGRRAK